MSKKEKQEIIDVDIDSLIPADYNPRKLTAKKKKDLLNSLKKYGIVGSIIVNNHEDRKNIIISGHQRTKLWKELGHLTIPVTYVTYDLEEEKEANIRFNKNNGEFDYSMLGVFGVDFLKMIGFEDSELSNIQEDFQKKLDKINDSNCDFPIIAEMSENYDYVIIVAKNDIDVNFLHNYFEIKKEKSYKNEGTGLGRVVTIEQFQKVIDERNS